MEVDRSAPAVAEAELQVGAPPEVVWDVMADVDRWPEWNPDVKEAMLEGALAPGSTFRWKAGPGTITSTLREVEPPTAIGWSGRTMGISALHVWRLEPRGEGTLVRTEESWNGLPVRVLRGRMQRTLQQAVDAGLRALKAEAERRGAG